ncbi:MAG: DUF5602 domain-containing protein [Saprospiraceae bacterium]|nr:DUF5602 domain-containing protein [Saprospiraceae bacterium]
MKMNPFLKTILLLLLGIAALPGCKDDKTLAGTFLGEKTALGDGTVQTYLVRDDDGQPVEAGVILTETAFASLPHEETALSLDFPKEAESTLVQHMGFDWNPHGHEPAGVYDSPHFDIHFYLISEAERMAISPTDTVKGNLYPDAAYLPADHIPTGFVPQMGTHWVDLQSPELNGQPFTSTFIFGSYDGEVNFYEPMITQNMVSLAGSLAKPIKQPQKYPVEGKYYAQTYGLRHDAGVKGYKFYLTDFEKR